MTTKQEKLYKSILLEIYKSGIDLNYNGFQLCALKFKSGEMKDKIKAYHLFFKSLGCFLSNKKFSSLNSNEFNIFLESIRAILGANSYVLTIDNRYFEDTIKESKKTLDFNSFLKVR